MPSASNRMNQSDPSGKFFMRELIEKATHGGGHVDYLYQLPNTNEWREKVSYGAGFEPWGWMVATGVMVEDVEAMHAAMTRSVLTCLANVAVLLLAAALVLTRSIVGPLRRLTASLRRLAGGDIEASVAGSARRDEFGTIARAVEDVRNAVRAQAQERTRRDDEARAEAARERLRQEEDARAQESHAKAAAERERRELLAELARALDAQVKAVADTVEASAHALVETARSMQSVSQAATAEAGHANAASRVAADHVSVVGHSTSQLDGAIGEIGARVQESSNISQDAVAQVAEANRIVRTLSQASAEIGKVVALIQAVAAADQPARAQRHHRGGAGRGGRQGASRWWPPRVKSLAGQTAKATEEISTRINAVVAATGEAAKAIENVGVTIARINEIAGTIAGRRPAAGRRDLRDHPRGRRDDAGNRVPDGEPRPPEAAAKDTNVSSCSVVTSASGLSSHAAGLKRQVDDFVAQIAAA